MVDAEVTTVGRPPALRFAVLGPVRVSAGSRRLPSGSPQQRALLAVLLLRKGRTATAHDLVNALWGEESPQQALAALRTYASRLRKSFGERQGVLVSELGGYALRLAPGDEFDLDTVGELTAAAEEAAAAGDPARAHALYGEALDLWDGEALGGIPGPEAEVERTRIEEQRLVLVEQRLDTGLQAGHHAESVSELTALTTAHPLRERLRELLMLALYRSGRQAEALAVYADARRLLIDELGVEPRAELSELQRRILSADESLNAAVPETPRAPALIRPAQLPAAVPDFTGRADFVAELGAQLAAAGGQVMAVSAVAGIGGVGKTTLAVQVAHAARDRFPDGQLYVDLQGAGPAPADPQTVLGAFLRALGVQDSAIPDGVPERAALYRSLLDGRRILALLDNARDAAQIRPLLPGTPGCATLVTSRTRLVDLAGAHLVDLDVMSPEEALTLFTRIVGDERVTSERDAAMDVVAACGFLPLAIRIAAARLAARRTWTVSVLARKLSDERRRLDELQAGDQAVAATFELGYGQLEPAQGRAFRLLGLAPGPDISLAAAAALLDLDEDGAEEVLESLVDTSLLESAAPGRYRFHDLVRLFARSCAERDEQPPSERSAAVTRLLDFYLATASEVYALERPGDRTVAHMHRPERPGLRFDGVRDGLDWLFREADNLLECVRQAPGGGEHARRIADLLVMCRDLYESGVYARQFVRAAEAVLESVEESKHPLAAGRIRASLANAYGLAERLDDAQTQAERALRLGRAGGDPLTVARALSESGILAYYRQDFTASRDHLDEALEAYRSYGDISGEASALSNLSRVHLMLGAAEAAVTLARESLGLHESLGSRLRLANGRYALGLALVGAGQPLAAIHEFEVALTTFSDARQHMWSGLALHQLAGLRLAKGDAGDAAALAERAIAELRHVEGSRREADALTTLGHCLQRVGQFRRAHACWEQALATYEALGRPEAEELRNHLSAGAV
ncbi:BTAD domain-containing putative transcriptional regulator [Streptomyces sp. RFCAC02]|uniref:AfsR/SARP family transcriptional regulator n=1 Tax=Streptomyces sp. RFCAC02 TaxID=2499143 RepID=UPI001020D19F|nr:BTAD domain-containing putative transcriptional regulator [Streptomyces sp. RFCAC02]